jgi:hypothetical protein
VKAKRAGYLRKVRQRKSAREAWLRRRDRNLANLPAEPKTKICPKGDRRRRSTSFNRATAQPDGLRPYCCDCDLQIVAKWRQDHPVKYKRQQRVQIVRRQFARGTAVKVIIAGSRAPKQLTEAQLAK